MYNVFGLWDQDYNNSNMIIEGIKFIVDVTMKDTYLWKQA